MVGKRNEYREGMGAVFYKPDNTVIVHITKVREKIEEKLKNTIYIKTV